MRKIETLLKEHWRGGFSFVAPLIVTLKFLLIDNELLINHGVHIKQTCNYIMAWISKQVSSGARKSLPLPNPGRPLSSPFVHRDKSDNEWQHEQLRITRTTHSNAIQNCFSDIPPPPLYNKKSIWDYCFPIRMHFVGFFIKHSLPNKFSLLLLFEQGKWNKIK